MLAGRELSESELSKELGTPMNTIGYNIRKLEEAGLIDKVKGFLWSVKGKRIHKYKISNKRIVISPRTMIRGIVPSVLISGLLALSIKLWIDGRIKEEYTSSLEVESAKSADAGLSSSIAVAEGMRFGNFTDVFIIAQNVWLWFLAGALSGILIYLIWNWVRK